jgi:plastocyanin
MKKRSKREILIIVALILGAILFKVVLSLVTSHVNTSATVNPNTLPVQSGHVTLTITNKQFHPVILVVTVGTTVTWVNHDPMAHSVTEGHDAGETPHGFNSGVLDSGKSWSYLFQTPGTYSYTCIFHPDMNAQVIVKPASSASPTPTQPTPTHRS